MLARIFYSGSEQLAAGNAGPAGFGTWPQLFQAVAAIANLAFVVYFFFRTRDDKRRELQLGVDSFWLQKVVVEPHAKRVDELHEFLEIHVLKSEKQANESHQSGAPQRELDEAVSSLADTASQKIEKFRFQIVPLVSVIVDDSVEDDSRPSEEINAVLDAMDEAVGNNIAEMFASPGGRSSSALESLRKGRGDLFRVLFRLHKHPFAQG